MISLVYTLLQSFAAFYFLLRGKGAIYLGKERPLPKDRKGPSFIIYAVSVGEVRAARILCLALQKRYPELFLSVFTRTKTGYEESKRSIAFADRHHFLPFDFSFLMKRMLTPLAPDVVIVIESDPWWRFLQEAHKLNALCVLVSGRLSERSYRSWKRVSFFAKRLFSCFSLVLAQDEESAERFRSFGVSDVRMTGNLKWGDGTIKGIDRKMLRNELGITEEDFLLVIGSSHAPEEELLLRELLPLCARCPHIKILLVPRHPERFTLVRELLRSLHVSFISYTQLVHKTGREVVILGDVMGKLRLFYALSDLAIVAGSFAPHLRGHNILEPIMQKVPVLFGPYMQDQSEFVKACLARQAGIQIGLSEVAWTIENLYMNKKKYKTFLSQVALFEGDINDNTESVVMLIDSKAFIVNNT